MGRLAKRLPVKAKRVEVLAPLRQEFVAGYDPTGLDPIIGGLLGTAQTAAEHFNEMLPLMKQAGEKLKEAMDADVPAEFVGAQASQAAGAVEKASRVVVQLAKALDGLSRLRSLLSGGPDQRIEQIQHMSERELMMLVLKAAGKCPKCGAVLAG